MIRFTLSETPEQEVINALNDIKRAQVNKTICEAVIYFKGKSNNPMRWVYAHVGELCGLSGNRVRAIYAPRGPRVNA